MEKAKAKEKVSYADKLDDVHRRRYFEKLAIINGFDPYKSNERDWSTDPNKLPPLEFGDLHNYVVLGKSAYTANEFKAYKALDAHVHFTNGWVQQLKLHVPENCTNTVVSAKVLHSQSLNDKPLNPWVIVDTSGAVLAAHCDCMAGLAEACTHIGGLLFKMEYVVRVRERPTVTGVPAYWMVPNSVTKVEPQVGYKIDYTTASAKKKLLDTAVGGNQIPAQQLVRTGAGTNKTIPKSTQGDFQALVRDLHATGDSAAILRVLPDYCQQFKDPVQPVCMPKSVRIVRNSACENMNHEELLQYCEAQNVSAVYNMSEEEATRVERETKEQFRSPAWFSMRAGRVTASQAHAVCTFDLQKPAVTTVKNVCYPSSKKVVTPAVKWGTDNEEKARKAYLQHAKKEHFGFCLERCGFFINHQMPYLGASPDGIVSCECCGKGCLEVKCPYKYKDKKISDGFPDKTFCLCEVNGQTALKKTSPYYYQVQCQILVTQTDFCDFVVWTSSDFAVFRIEPDAAVQETIKQKASAFCKSVALPEMVAKYFTIHACGTSHKRKHVVSI